MIIHIQGEHMLGAMIVALPDGLQKSQYRKLTYAIQTLRMIMVACER